MIYKFEKGSWHSVQLNLSSMLKSPKQYSGSESTHVCIDEIITPINATENTRSLVEHSKNCKMSHNVPLCHGEQF